MTNWVLGHEGGLRLGIFAGVLLVMILWETVAARRPLRHSRWRRWPANLGIVVVGTLLVRVLFPTAAIAVAMTAGEQGWGLLAAIDLPTPMEIVLAVMLLDLAIYLQHVMFHAVPVLWKLHMVHHADQDFDVTTGSRFHPIEIVLSMIIKLGVVLALGAAPIAVFLFHVLLNATAMFNHGNVRIPAKLDRWLRLLVVTPDMHRVHHSVVIGESNSNFGFNLPWWDRLLGTYRSQPAAGHHGMTIGVRQLQNGCPMGLWGLLKLPFVSSPGDYAIDKRF